MNWSKWIRQIHPLFLLMFTGLYMFFLPYVAKPQVAQGSSV